MAYSGEYINTNASYSVYTIDNGYILTINNASNYYRTKKQVVAQIAKHLAKELK